MCTKQPVFIKGVSRYSPNFSFVPCGECEECRSVQRSSWCFRLRAEVDALLKRGWWLGFITLTFNDQNLPHIPRELISQDCDKYNSILTPACFSKEIARNFLTSFRQWLIHTYDVCTRKDPKTNEILKNDSLRYMFCSEYGECTQRPHHHFLVCLPAYVPQLSVYKWLCKNWPYGYKFPKEFDGGIDSHGYQHQPFVVKSAISAVSYVSKYVCKDLAFFESFSKADFRKSVGDLKLSDYMPFHMQSKSLGLAFVKNLSVDQKLDFLRNGVSMDGVDKLVRLPVYIKNKLIFDNYYILSDEGKRLCRREANQFFRENYEQIFEAKVSDVVEKVQELKTLPLPPELAKFSSFAEADKLFRNSDLREVASDFVAFGGVRPIDVPVNIRPCDFWVSRYLCCSDSQGVYDVDLSEYYGDNDTQDSFRDYLDKLNLWFNALYCVDNNIQIPLDKLKRESNRQRAYFADLYSSED